MLGAALRRFDTVKCRLYGAVGTSGEVYCDETSRAERKQVTDSGGHCKSSMPIAGMSGQVLAGHFYNIIRQYIFVFKDNEH